MSEPSETPNTTTTTIQVQQPTTIPIFTSKLLTPPNINLKGDLREHWKQWRHICDAYALVTGLNQQSNEFKVATFVTCIGQEALQVHNSLLFKKRTTWQEFLNCGASTATARQTLFMRATG